MHRKQKPPNISTEADVEVNFERPPPPIPPRRDNPTFAEQRVRMGYNDDSLPIRVIHRDEEEDIWSMRFSEPVAVRRANISHLDDPDGEMMGDFEDCFDY